MPGAGEWLCVCAGWGLSLTYDRTLIDEEGRLKRLRDFSERLVDTCFCFVVVGESTFLTDRSLSDKFCFIGLFGFIVETPPPC